MPVLDVVQVVELERRIAEAGTPLSVLMARAGAALAGAALGLAASRGGEGEPRFVVMCGSGNNGGDGWVAAQLLAQRGCSVDVITSTAPADVKAQPAHDAAVRAERSLESCVDSRVHVSPSAEQVEKLVGGADAVVDAILGTGFSGNVVRAPYAEWIRVANNAHAHGVQIVSADAPSGLSAQTGVGADPCIEADLTVTMIVQKTGLATPQAARYCGRVEVAPLVSVEGLLDGLVEG